MQIEYRFDIFSVVIFIGVVLGFYIAYFFVYKKARRRIPNILFALMIICLALILLEIFLNYTGIIVHCININNFSEPISFMVAPLLYLYILSVLKKKINSNHLLHFLPFVLWALYSIPDFSQPAINKMNDFLRNFDSTIQHLENVPWKNPDPMNLRTYVNVFLVVQLLIYIGFSLLELKKAFKEKSISFFKRGIKPLSWLRDLTFIFLFIVVVVIIVKAIYYKDIGDYLIASYISISLIITTIYIIRSSPFFQESVSLLIYENRKYQKSSLNEEQKENIVLQINDYIIDKKYFKNNLASLPGLSKISGVPVHHLSQVINEKLNMTFFELIARNRIKESQLILKDKEQENLTIEEIAEEVGYNSKSAFNKTFKKITGLTPSQFRNT